MEDVTRALQLSWRALLRDVDNGVDHMAIQRAARHATKSHERKTAGWYTAAIIHYLDR